MKGISKANMPRALRKPRAQAPGVSPGRKPHMLYVVACFGACSSCSLPAACTFASSTQIFLISV
jgi:hypothetical protein